MLGLLRQELLAMAKVELSIRASNQRAFHSSRDLHLRQVPCIRWVVEQILTFATQTLARPVQVSGMWAVVMAGDGSLVPHQHFPSPFCGVVYLDSPSWSSPSQGDCAGKLEFVNPLALPESFDQPGGILVAPQEGMILVFPGALVHLVHPHRSEGLRLSISFNLELIA